MKALSRDAALERGRAAFAARSWRDAHTALQSADRETPLEPADLERLAAAARLMGRDAEGLDPLTRAHQGYQAAGDVESAARCAFWIGYALMFRGDQAQSGGWLARAQRLLDDHGRDCVERGWLLLPGAIRCVMTG